MNDENMYDFETLMSLNHPDLSNINLKLVDFFSELPSYPITKEIRIHYPNKFNYNFNRRKIRPKTVISSDPQILKQLRSNLSKLSPNNIEIITENIKELLGHEHHDWNSISQLFYVIIIDNVNVKETLLTQLYVQLLVKLQKYYDLLLHYLHHKIRDQLLSPAKFQNTFSESGKDKEKRWILSNCLLILEIYHQGKYSKKHMHGMLTHLASQIGYENTISLEAFIVLLPKMNSNDLPPEISEKLISVINDKTYPTRLRLLLNLPKRSTRSKRR